MRQSDALRETTSTTLDRTQSISDGVLFEFDDNRTAALNFREQVRKLLPQLRSIFVMRILALDYRLRLPALELPEDALHAQNVFDQRSADVLEGLADEIEFGETERVTQPISISTRQTGTREPSNLALLRRMDKQVTALAKQVDGNFVQQATQIR
jgi:hypothetical protein